MNPKSIEGSVTLVIPKGGVELSQELTTTKEKEGSHHRDQHDHLKASSAGSDGATASREPRRWGRPPGQFQRHARLLLECLSHLAGSMPTNAGLATMAGLRVSPPSIGGYLRWLKSCGAITVDYARFLHAGDWCCNRKCEVNPRALYGQPSYGGAFDAASAAAPTRVVPDDAPPRRTRRAAGPTASRGSGSVRRPRGRRRRSRGYWTTMYIAGALTP